MEFFVEKLIESISAIQASFVFFCITSKVCPRMSSLFFSFLLLLHCLLLSVLPKLVGVVVVGVVVVVVCIAWALLLQNAHRSIMPFTDICFCSLSIRILFSGISPVYAGSISQIPIALASIFLLGSFSVFNCSQDILPQHVS